MESNFLKKISEVKKYKAELEKKLNIKIKIVRNKVFFEGSALDEYEASSVFDALGFGFSIRQALMLKEEDFMFKVVHIKEHTKRNLRDVKSRLIGKKGKTKKTFSEISNCEVMIREGEVGIIGEAEAIDDVVTAVIHVIRGSKQGNMYRYLEKMNRVKKSQEYSEI